MSASAKLKSSFFKAFNFLSKLDTEIIAVKIDANFRDTFDFGIHVFNNDISETRSFNFYVCHNQDEVERQLSEILNAISEDSFTSICELNFE